MKRYPKYKDSDIEWIGEIPENWNLYRIKSVVESSVNGVWGDEPTGDENDLICVRVADFNMDTLGIDKDELTLRNIPQGQLSSRILRKSNLLIEKSGGGDRQPVGRMIRYDLGETAVCSNFIGKITVIKNEFISDYLLYYANNLYSKKVNTRSIKQTTGIQNLDLYSYFNEKIPIPPLTEQQSIANYLDHKTAKIDSLIEKKKRLIELLKEERIAVINQAVTKGLDPNVPMKDSGIEWLGEIPEHWDVKKLKQFTTKITDGEHISPNFQSEGMPFLSAKDVRERTINFDGNKFVSIEDGIKFRKRCDPVRGDVLLVSRGATIGRIGLVETDDTFCLLGSVILLKPLERGSPLLLYYVLNNSRIQEQLLLTSQSSAQQAIYLVGVSELLITIPPANEQPLIIKHIEKETTRIDSIISKTEKEIELLREYRIALISEVVTGKIDVREEKI